jgi:hypothetical protein
VKAKDGDHKLESMVADFSWPAEPELRQATRLASRGGRSERDCGLSSAPGREIEELLPRAQQFADARSREVLKLLDLEADVAAARRCSSSRRPRKLDPVRDHVVAFLARHSEIKGRRGLGRAIAFGLDDQGIKLRDRYARKTGKRLWREVWDDRTHPKIRNDARKFIYSRFPKV